MNEKAFSTCNDGILDLMNMESVGDSRSTSHRSHAPFRQEANFSHTAVRNPEGEFENISAGWIFNLSERVGIANFTRVARILKMIKKLRGVHQRLF